MKGRREIVDPLTGAKASPSSPAAIDTGRVIVGRHTIVPDEDLDPTQDRFGIARDAESDLRQRIAESKRGPRQKVGRTPGIKPKMESPAKGVEELEQLNPTFFEAIEDADLRDVTNDFMDRIEVKRGRKSVRLNETPAGRRILETTASGAGRQGASGATIARNMFKYLFGQSRSGRWRDVPWEEVRSYAQVVGEAADSPSSVVLPIAAGVDPPDVIIARAREELGTAAANKVIRQINAEELRSLGDRLSDAIAKTGEECLTGEALKVAKERLRQIRAWQRRPELVPAWSCVGSENSLGQACAFPGLLKDIERIENACEVDYDPRWPVEAAERACAEGEEEGRTGVIGEPCAVKAPPRGGEKRSRYEMRYGRLVKV